MRILLTVVAGTSGYRALTEGSIASALVAGSAVVLLFVFDRKVLLPFLRRWYLAERENGGQPPAS